MLMAVFGAGASYDSAQGFPLPPQRPTGGQQNFGVPSPAAVDLAGPWRPPLANGLFRDPNHAFGHIVQKYSKLAHILPYLRDPSHGRSVEEVLESLQVEADGFPERLREFAAVRFYLRDLLFEVSDRWRDTTSGVTNYAPLIGEVLRHSKDEAVCLVTFNYDLLLDRALVSFGYQPQEPADQFKAHKVLNLFKPHGSVDWARFVAMNPDTRLLPQHLIEQAETIQLTDEFVRVTSIHPHDFPRGRTVFPVIAIPFQNKTENTFECPLSHLTRLCDMLPHVRKILIIGWQAREAHFLNLLRSHLRGVTHVMVVGSNSADSDRVLQYFVGEIAKTVHPNFQSYRGQSGFTNFVVNREGDAFFGATGVGAI